MRDTCSFDQQIEKRLSSFVTSTELSSTVQELKATVMSGIAESTEASLSCFGSHLAVQLQMLCDRVQAIERTIVRLDSYCVSAEGKHAFLDYQTAPVVASGISASILEHERSAVQKIQSSWRAFMGWSLGKACAQKLLL